MRKLEQTYLDNDLKGFCSNGKKSKTSKRSRADTFMRKITAHLHVDENDPEEKN